MGDSPFGGFTSGLVDLGQFNQLLNPQQPAGINPALAAWFQQQGIDLNQFLGQNQVNLSQQGQDFNQLGSQYPMRMGNALLDAYQKNYAPTEMAARDYAQSALSGQITPTTQNILNQMNIASSQQRQNAMRQEAAKAAAMNIDPSSPAYRSALRNIDSEYMRQNAQGKAGVINQQALQGIQNALRIMENAQQSNRLAGTVAPEVPQTYAQAQAAAQKAAQAANSGVRARYGLRSNIGTGQPAYSGAAQSAYRNALGQAGYQGMPMLQRPTSYNVPSFMKGGDEINPGLEKGGGNIIKNTLSQLNPLNWF